MKTVFGFFNPSRGKAYSHVNPWYAAMEHFTDDIGWKTPGASAGRLGFSSPRRRIHSSSHKSKS